MRTPNFLRLYRENAFIRRRDLREPVIKRRRFPFGAYSFFPVILLPFQSPAGPGLYRLFRTRARIPLSLFFRLRRSGIASLPGSFPPWNPGHRADIVNVYPARESGRHIFRQFIRPGND